MYSKEPKVRSVESRCQLGIYQEESDYQIHKLNAHIPNISQKQFVTMKGKIHFMMTRYEIKIQFVYRKGMNLIIKPVIDSIQKY